MKPKFRVGSVVYFTDFSYSRRVFAGRPNSKKNDGIHLYSPNAEGPFVVVDFKRRRTTNFMQDRDLRNSVAVRSIADPDLVVATQKRFLSKTWNDWSRLKETA
jgi:hypothetical protein